MLPLLTRTACAACASLPRCQPRAHPLPSPLPLSHVLPAALPVPACFAAAQSVDIREAPNKPPRQPRLVAPLRIQLPGQEQPELFEDLDEVVAR